MYRSRAVLRRRSSHLLVALAVAATAVSAVAPPAAALTPAPHTALPTLAKNQYTPGLPLRVVTFVKADRHPNDPTTFASRVIWFGHALVKSHWYDAVSSYYHFGADGASASLRVTNMPTADSTMTAAKLTAKVRSWVHKLGLKKNRKYRTIFVVYLPCVRGTKWGIATCPVSFHPGLTLTSGDPDFSARDSMAVVSLPTDQAPSVNSTATASHEIIEAATNHEPGGAGYRLHTATPNAPFDVSPWIYNENMNGNTEVMDMSGGSRITEHFSSAVHGYDYRYERVFTNRSAKANRDPFVPASPLGYASVTNATSGWVVQSSGHAKHTITLTAWSTKSVPKWRLSVSVAAWKGGSTGSVDRCSAALSRKTVQNGTGVTLTVTYSGSGKASYWCAIKVKSTTAGASSTDTRNDKFRQWLVGLRLRPPA